MRAVIMAVEKKLKLPSAEVFSTAKSKRLHNRHIKRPGRFRLGLEVLSLLPASQIIGIIFVY
jgi:hypothetical protein